ncbi:MAG TPA: shikimate dehydrogenase [Blastocatellia bacterium]|nr:shikimate dehydrogenase [Blastocatellia bacterium]
MRICAVIAEDTVAGARAALERAAPVADLAELRLDYLRDFDFSGTAALQCLLDQKPLPVIITCRSFEEGGNQRIDDDLRIRLLVEGTRTLADYCDIEESHYDRTASLNPDLSRLIVSYHNFHETPRDLDDIYERLCSRKAAVHKIAVKSACIQDTIALFGLIDRAAAEGRNLIAVSMGEPGLITRILGPARGAFLTYGSLDVKNTTAAGQVSCEDLRSVYRLDQISRSTTVLGIIGNPISHSASPMMHNKAAAALGLDLVYLPIEVQDLPGFIARLAHPRSREMAWPLAGFSVTIPHKEAIVPLLDRLDEVSRAVGAVNTVVIQEAELHGYNTDVAGSIEPLERIATLAGSRCAVVGSGGSARAVVYGLARKGARVTVYARNLQKGSRISADFADSSVEAAGLSDLASCGAEIVINTTPLGMSGSKTGQSAVPREALARCKIAYDLVYNPLETPFLAQAREVGCQTISGIEMLAAQAAHQFLLWTGKRAPRELMLAQAMQRICAVT